MKRDVFYAIADPTRREIILMTANGVITPSKVAKKFKKMTRQAVSCHIQVLVDCGVLDHRKVGRTIHYELKHKKLNAIYKYLEKMQDIRTDAMNRVNGEMLGLIDI